MTHQRESQPDASSHAALMQWYLEAGVDETIGDAPVNRFIAPPPARVGGSPPPASARLAVGERSEAAAPRPRRPLGLQSLLPEETVVQHAVSLASGARSLESLREALERFEGCPLKRTATNLVFGRGNPAARIVFVGEAPGAEEDVQGLPFVGPSGRLLNRILGSIGLTSKDVFITNTVFWRPPGNRSPTSSETAACMPFLQRMLELIHPDVLVALGGPAATALLGRAESVGRLRGHWFSYQTPGLSRPVSVIVTFHPAYLLRSPAQKRLAWRDFLAIKRKLAGSDQGARSEGS